MFNFTNQLPSTKEQNEALKSLYNNHVDGQTESISLDDDSINLLVLLDKENLDNVSYNKNKFNHGVDEMSELAGKISALVNVGVSPDNALEYICAIQTNELNVNLQKEITVNTNETNIETARIIGENQFKQNFN